MRMTTRILLLTFLITVASCTSAKRSPSSTQASSKDSLPFTVLRACFSGMASSYDDWSNAVVANNVNASLSRFQTRFPENKYDEYKENLDCDFINYPVGELIVDGVFIRPKNAHGTALPVVIVNRGGNATFGTWNISRLFHTVLPLANEGFAIIASQYRGSRIGDESALKGQDEFGGDDINDVLTLIELVDEIPGLDSTRIGMFGWSRGGMMTYLAATKTDRLRAIAVGGTPTDLAAELFLRPAMEKVFEARIPDYAENKNAALEARSASRWADELPRTLPILILHGQSDKSVSLASALRMAAILQELKHPFKMVVYENGSHGLTEYSDEIRFELSTWFRGKLERP